MSGLKGNNLLASMVLTLSAGLTIAWLGGWMTNDHWWPIRAMMLAIVLAIAGGAALLIERQRKKESRLAARHFEGLWQLDVQAKYTDLTQAGLVPLPPKNPWHDIAERIRDLITRLYQRIHESELARASMEVRCRRAVTEAEGIRRIFDGLADPILAIDDYEDVLLANRSAESLFQFDMQKSESKALARLVHCQKLVQLLASTRQRKTATRRTDEIDIVDDEGISRWYRATAVKMATEGQNGPQEFVADGAVVMLRDIGEQKAMQKRNAEFVSSVSHEMKTPLAGIKAYVELLVDGDAEDEETREEFLDVINGQADRLQRLIDNMLNLARIEAGVVQVSKQPCSLNELLEESLRVVQPSAEAKQIHLVPELSPLYLSVYADRDMLLQASINLLSNAVKYTPNGGKVILHSRLDDDQVRFDVQDTGVGLSEEDCARVFEKFYRVMKDKSMASGTGLGLPLAKHIVEDVHGGKLTVESILGQGSTFIVKLPSAGQIRSEGRGNEH
jgi:two-component system, OmpR family, phosphate regulon sensor histidine kinase PhoR